MGSRKLTPKKQKIFLGALSECGNVTESARVADVNRETCYVLRRHDEGFRALWDEALGLGVEGLEDEGRRRAYRGVRKLKFHEGRPIMVPLLVDGVPTMDAQGEPILVPYVEHDYSDTLLIFLLKGAKPDKYRENRQGGSFTPEDFARSIALLAGAVVPDAEDCGDPEDGADAG